MYKLVIYMLLLALFTILYALQTEQEMAMQALFRAKRSINYAAHAAAQQVDPAKLSVGVVALDPIRAEATALDYLRANLQLDTTNMPLPGAFFRSRVEVLVFDIVNNGVAFPYTYTNAAYGISATLHDPGVVLVAKVEYPRTFSLLAPIVWNVKGVAELVR